ncbi:MAG: DUF4338 domain-containing protein [Candidatus Neomarinimicrobiota bacterium]
MSVKLRYRGREVTDSDVEFIRELIAAHRGKSRRELSAKLCEAWNWVQPNGAPRDMVCRGLMLQLHRAGHIELPAVRRVNPNPFLVRQRPAPVLVDRTPWVATLAEIGPLEFEQVRRKAGERFFNGLIEQYHYLGYTQPVGEHLKYLIHAQGRPLACLAWCSSPRHIGCRDRFIGWPLEARRRNIRFLAYNTRFLIVPWVRVPHLASHILGRMATMVARDWERVYEHPVYFLETFVDPERFRGTCYRAANWIFLGRTTGRGKDSPSKKPNRPIKEVLGYPLHKRFRELLGQQ